MKIKLPLFLFLTTFVLMLFIGVAYCEPVTTNSVGKTLVVPIQFSDAKFTKTKANVNSYFFGNTNSLKSYFLENSRGLFELTGGVADIVTSDKLKLQYSADLSGDPDVGEFLNTAQSRQALAVEAFKKFYATQGASFGLDAYLEEISGAYYVKNFIIVCQGKGQEETLIKNDIFSQYIPNLNLNTGINHNGKPIRLSSFSIINEHSSLGIGAYIFANSLGAEDLYDKDYDSFHPGNWTLMGYGFQNGTPRGSQPAHLSVWEKLRFGWVDPVVLTDSVSGIVVGPVEQAGGKVYQIPIKYDKNNNAVEYFLLENRSKVGYDSKLPGEGLLIWHIDETVSHNSNQNRYRVALEQADGRKDLEKRVNYGDSTDPYPIAANNTFSSISNPASTANDNKYTNILVKNIKRSGVNIVADVVITDGFEPAQLYTDETGTRIRIKYNGVQLRQGEISTKKFTLQADDDLFAGEEIEKAIITGDIVELQLKRHIGRHYQEILLSYSGDNYGGETALPILSTEGICAKSFENLAVTNNSSAVCPYPADFAGSIKVHETGNMIRVTYDVDLQNKADMTKGSYTVRVNGQTVGIKSVYRLPAAPNTVEISLNQVILSTEPNVTLSYDFTKNCVISMAGVHARPFSNLPVENRGAVAIGAPKILSVSPGSGTNLEHLKTHGELIIMGEHFDKAKNNVVYFIGPDGEREIATVAAEGGIRLQVQLPTDLIAGEYDVKVAAHGQEGVLKKAFTVVWPDIIIDRVGVGGTFLVEGEILDTASINIEGKNFSPDPQGNEVFIIQKESGATTKVAVTSNTQTRLFAKLPMDTKKGTYEVKIVRNDGNIGLSGDKTFTVAPNPNETQPEPEPEELLIVGISTSGATLKEAEISGNVTIFGNNFSSSASSNVVKIVNASTGTSYNATVQSASKTEITAKLPTALAAATYRVSVTVGGKTATSGSTFTVAKKDEPIIPSEPVITGISTSGATLKETEISGNVTIFGNNFSSSASSNVVKIINASTGTSYNATVQSASKTEITAKLPTTLAAATYRVSVTVGGKTATSSSTFTVAKKDEQIIPSDPTIIGISTSGATLKETEISGNVTIFGNNFSSSASSNAVKIINASTGTSYNATVQSASKTEVTAKLPTTLVAGTYRVSVTVGGKTATSSSTFTVAKKDEQIIPSEPVITGISTSGATLIEDEIWGNVVITGKNFSPTTSGNSVSFINTSTGKSFAATVTNAKSTQLTAKLPISLYAGTYRVSVTVSGMTTTSSQTFRIREPYYEDDLDEYDTGRYDSKTNAGRAVELRVRRLKDMLKNAVEDDDTRSIDREIDSIIDAMDGANTDEAIIEVMIQSAKAFDYLRPYAKDVNRRSSIRECMIENLMKIVDALSDLAHRIRSELTAIDFTKKISTLIGYLSEIAEKARDYDLLDKLVSVLRNVADGVGHIIDVIRDELKGYDSLQNFFNNLKKIFSKIESSEVSQKFKDAIKNIIQGAVGEQSVYTLKANSSGKVVLTGKTLDDILIKARTIDSKVSKIVEDAEYIAGMPIEGKRLILEVDSSANAKEVTLEFSNGNLFSLIDKTGIDAWELRTRHGDIVIRNGSVKLDSDTRGVVISIREVDNIYEVDNRYVDYFRNDKIYDVNMSCTKRNGTISEITQMDKEIMIRLPFTLRSGQSEERVAVLYLSPDGIPENMLAGYDSDLRKATFWTEHLSQYAVRYNDIYFTDVTPDNWAKKYIDAMAARGIAMGVGGGMFNPFANVTRAEFASYIVRTFKAYSGNHKSTFADVDEGAWYYQTVASAAANGIVKGIPGNKFDPTGYITRQDMAVMLVRAIERFMGSNAPKTGNDARDLYDYATIADYARDSVNSAGRYEIMSGKPGGYFAPYDLATRAEAVTVMYRLLELKDRK